MAYRITRKIDDGIEAHESDCVYDFNHFLPNPLPEPNDGDWHSLDDEVETRLVALGWDVSETN